MDYFKHYSNASESKLLNHLFDEFKHTGYACYFLLLELCSEHWDGQAAPKFTFHERIVRQKLRISRTKLNLFLNICSTNSNLLFEFSEKELHLELPKLLEIKTSRKVIKSNKKELPVYIDKDIRIDIDKESKQSKTELSNLLDSVLRGWNKLIEKDAIKGKARSRNMLSSNALRDFNQSCNVFNTQDQWRTILLNISTSEYASGRSGRVTPTIEFYLKYDNALKAFDNLYADRKEATSENKPNKSAIHTAISSGADRIANVEPGILSEIDISFIQDHGGLANLGRMNDFQFDQIFRGSNAS